MLAALQPWLQRALSYAFQGIFLRSFRDTVSRQWHYQLGWSQELGAECLGSGPALCRRDFACKVGDGSHSQRCYKDNINLGWGVVLGTQADHPMKLRPGEDGGTDTGELPIPQVMFCEMEKR